MRIEVDVERCCGSGNCVLAVPTVFDQDDQRGLVVLLDPQPPAAVHDLVRRAVDVCPSGAIRLVAD